MELLFHFDGGEILYGILTVPDLEYGSLIKEIAADVLASPPVPLQRRGV
jgi:hypothetical protein